MPDIRRNPITGEPVIISTSRADRPGAWSEAPSSGDRDVCPFCPGHEAETPPEIVRDDDEWTVRVFPNKYPAVEGHSAPAHEVLVDSRDHDRPFHELSASEMERAVRLWQRRARVQVEDPSSRYVCVFRNEGRGAGQSISHPHGQVLALDFVPPRIIRELHGFSGGSCPLCTLVSRGAKELAIDHAGTLLLLSTPAPRFPLEMWITSTQHTADWIDMPPADLATLLLSATCRLRDLHPDAPFNIGMITAPVRTEGAERFHAYVEVTPRLTNLAGFEMSTGGWISIESPEQAAEKLRSGRLRMG